MRPVAEDKLAVFLLGLGFQVISFDPSGAYSSDRQMIGKGNLADGIPNAQLMIFENSGHFPFIEEQEQFIQALVDFFNQPHEQTS